MEKDSRKNQKIHKNVGLFKSTIERKTRIKIREKENRLGRSLTREEKAKKITDIDKFILDLPKTSLQEFEISPDFKSVDKRIIIENGPAISNESEVIVREFTSDKKYLMKFRLSA